VDTENTLKIDNKSRYICPECKGNKYTESRVTPIEIIVAGRLMRVPGKMEHTNCQKCDGEGYLDWVEKVVGKKINSGEQNGQS